MSTKNDDFHINQWSSNFGNDYIKRNPIKVNLLTARLKMWETLLEKIDTTNIFNFCEIGCNIGYNLRAIKKLKSFERFAIEPNYMAREILLKDKVLDPNNLKSSTADDIDFSNQSMGIVLTYGVLIHISDEKLSQSMNEIYRVSKKYIICIEYFSDKPSEVNYGDGNVLLIKRDYGSLWLEKFPKLSLVDYGFFWKKVTMLDNVNWWIFEKYS